MRLVTPELGQARPSELRLREGSFTPSSRSHAPICQLTPHEQTHGLSSQTTEMENDDVEAHGHCSSASYTCALMRWNAGLPQFASKTQLEGVASYGSRVAF